MMDLLDCYWQVNLQVNGRTSALKAEHCELQYIGFQVTISCRGTIAIFFYLIELNS